MFKNLVSLWQVVEKSDLAENQEKKTVMEVSWQICDKYYIEQVISNFTKLGIIKIIALIADALSCSEVV